MDRESGLAATSASASASACACAGLFLDGWTAGRGLPFSPHPPHPPRPPTYYSSSTATLRCPPSTHARRDSITKHQANAVALFFLLSLRLPSSEATLASSLMMKPPGATRTIRTAENIENMRTASIVQLLPHCIDNDENYDVKEKRAKNKGEDKGDKDDSLEGIARTAGADDDRTAAFLTSNESRNSIPSEYRTDGVSPEVGGSIIYGGDEKTIEAGRSTVEPREQFSSTEINADTPLWTLNEILQIFVKAFQLRD
ncbi:hypothetical protein HZH66_000856 [Vespula vulgaris]|uniref:Uncharacterized protein n=1 Tax=Vespula vulgaris TaxID=7454 RepID=A0A834NJ15_VESVU|nr:hypothetical protein HZH66_000856 [Vespula vulgaris]